MRKLFFVISIGALSSGVVGLGKAIWAAVENNWLDLDYLNLIWRYWENNIGLKRIIASIPLSLALLYLKPNIAQVKTLQRPLVAFTCLVFALLPYIVNVINAPSLDKPNIPVYSHNWSYHLPTNSHYTL